MDILDYMGVSKLSAKVFLKVNYSFNIINWFVIQCDFVFWLMSPFREHFWS